MLSRALVGLAALCAFIPVTAQAATWTLDFSGPQSAEFVIEDLYGSPYVSSFSATGAAAYDAVPTAVPADWNTTLPDTPANEAIMFHPKLLSNVTLTDTGGHIRIFPGLWYEGDYDGHFNLDLTYMLSSPETVGSDFTDNAITGSYSFSYFVNAAGFGSDHDFSGAGTGTLTRLTAFGAVPEPADWMLAMIGLGAVGAGIRMHRRFRQDLATIG
jgi:hypothetical protein